MEYSQPIRGIIFDFDGTLFNLAVNWSSLKTELTQILSPLGIHVSERGITNSIAAAPAHLKSQMKDLTLRYELQGVNAGQPIRGASEIVSWLKAKGLKTAIVSRNHHQTISAALERFQIPQPDVILGQEDCEHQKPHPAPLLQAVNLMNLPVTTTLCVGDTSHDIDGASACGMPSVLLVNPNLDYQPHNAHYRITTLEELTDATRFRYA